VRQCAAANRCEHDRKAVKIDRFAVLLKRVLGATFMVKGMQAPLSTKPIRAVLKWQAIATGAMAVVAWVWAGRETAGAAALSAVLGGVINITAVVVYAVVLGVSNPTTAGGTVAAMFRAEACKILVIVVQLWLVLTLYKEVVLAALFAAFAITVLLFRMAFFDRD
jgi:ATP synthase protein I